MIPDRPLSKGTIVRLLVTILVLCLACGANADDWTDGNDAFARGDFAAALAYFEAARDAGMSGPAVHYNIAVCEYRLERWTAAEASFTSGSSFSNCFDASTRTVSSPGLRR